MSEEIEVSCFNRKCKDCPDHAISNSKIVCNRDNRLGLRAATVEDFFFKKGEKE